MQSDSAVRMVDDTPSLTRMVIPGEPFAVRQGLQALFATKMLRQLSAEERGTAEIVLAEALNNIVEHAYARHVGTIDITLRQSSSEIMCRIVDNGLPLPNEALPEGVLKPLNPDVELPEGGFGWFLIRTLSRDLHYHRDGDLNLLSFCLETEQCLHPERLVSES